MRVRARVPADDEAVTRLMAAGADRVEAVDPRARLARAPAVGDALVAVDAAGVVHGHVRPVVEELAAEDEARMYAPDRWVAWADVAADGPEAVLALAEALRRAGTAGADADSVLWPAADEVAVEWWLAAGMEASAHYAVRPTAPLAAGPQSGVTVRPATADDLDTVLALHREAVAFQAAVSPYVRVVPGSESGFSRRLLDGSSTTHVLDRDGELLGVAEWMPASSEPAGDATSLLPPGRYAYVNSVGIRFDDRGGGLGRTLVAGVLAAAGPDLAGTALWFSAHNPVASRVWPHLGWRPLWTMWERRSS